MKIRKLQLTKFAVLLYIAYFYYNQIIVAVMGYRFSVYMIYAATALAAIGMNTFKKSNRSFLLLWVMLIVLYMFNNRAMVHGNTTYALIYLCYFIGGLFLSNCDLRIAEFACKGLAYTGIFNVLFTVLFFFFPSLYSSIPSILGATPTWGIGAGIEYGYRAGITLHYSSNGIYCAIELISLFSLFLFSDESKKNKKRIGILLGLAATALLLTTKRGHLVFSVCALMLMWYFCSQGKQITRFIKLLVVSILIVTVFFIVAPYVPVIQNTLMRFMDSSDISSGRFLIWEHAIASIEEHPIFGVGWWGFYYDVLKQSTVAGASNVHNVYLQLLCETGIIGFFIMLVFFIVHLLSTIRLAKFFSVNGCAEVQVVLAFSLSLQFFFLLYAFTGNDLYDFTVISYVMACIMVTSLKNYRLIWNRGN